MRTQERAFTTAIAIALAVGVALPPTLARAELGHAPGGPTQTFYDKVSQAEEAEAAGQLQRAAELYTEAYDALPPSERAGETGSDVVRAATRVRRDLFFQSPKDPAPLDASAVLLERHIGDVKQHAPSRDVSAFEKELSSVQSLREGLEKPKKPEPEPDPKTTPVEPDPDPIEPKPDPERDNLAPDRRPLGLGLTIGGAIGVVGGAVLLAVGGNLFSVTTKTYLANSDEAPSDCTVEGNICALNTWRDGEYRRANALMAVGGVLAVVGIGLVIGGTVVLVRSKNARRMSLLPTHSGQMTGLVWSGRF